MKSQENKPKKV